VKSIYFKNFAATAVMVMFSFLILGTAFVFLGRSYVISEYRDNMVSNAEEVSHAAQALVRDGELSNWDLRMVISTLAQSTGNHIFITDTKRGMYDLEREVRFIDVSDFDVAGEAALCGFIKGVIAGNHDNEYVYIDGVMRIAGKNVNDLAGFFYMLDKVAEENGLTVTVSVSAAKEELPDFVKKYL